MHAFWGGIWGVGAGSTTAHRKRENCPRFHKTKHGVFLCDNLPAPEIMELYKLTTGLKFLVRLGSETRSTIALLILNKDSALFDVR
jgi:hypothetical protein